MLGCEGFLVKVLPRVRGWCFGCAQAGRQGTWRAEASELADAVGASSPEGRAV